MFSQLAALRALLLFSSFTSALPQGPNTVAINNPNVRTMANNGTFFLVPISTNTVQNSVSYPLLPVPTNDATLFPSGFPIGYHPVLVSSAYSSDIRMSALEIDSLLSGSVYVPFVDRLRDGKTAFTYPNNAIVGGTNGQVLMGTVPAVVGTITGGQIINQGQFLPNNAAWEQTAPGQFSTQGKVFIVPNPVSGPGVVPSLYDIAFSTAANPIYTIHTFHSILNQPLIQSAGLCFRNTVYFNETFSEQTLRTGTVTLYNPPTGAGPNGFGGVYTNAGGFTGAGENIGYNPQDCAAASADVDPAAAN